MNRQGSRKIIVDLKITMNQFNIIKMYTIFTQQQDTNSIQVPIDCKPGETGTYPGYIPFLLRLMLNIFLYAQHGDRTHAAYNGSLNSYSLDC